jgi:signal transduction histidine kinase
MIGNWGRTALVERPRPGVSLSVRRRRAVSCWLGLLGLATVLMLSGNVLVAGPNRDVATIIATLAGAVGSALLYLGTVRFLIFGRPLDICIGLAFGSLALADLLVNLVVPAVGLTPARGEVGLYLLLVFHAVAALLFFIPLLRAEAVIGARYRWRYAWWLIGGTVLGLALISVSIVSGSHLLPAALGPSGRNLLVAGAVMWGTLPGQEPWLVLSSGAISVVMFLATYGYGKRSDALEEEVYLEPLTVALSLLSFGQFCSLVFPPVGLNYVSIGSIFWLAAYLVLLAAFVRTLGHDIVERAGREERLRLSRELHDGLMQQLSLLNVRLDRASAPNRSVDARARDLEGARRVLEAALVEARQSIVALRTGTVSWDELVYALGAFGDEFAANHDVTILVHGPGNGLTLDAELQGDVLRILQETFSNAIRHGAATQIEVTVVGQPDQIQVRVQDDGQGFAPKQLEHSGGVGLRSLAERVARRGGAWTITSHPGQGATVEARIPLLPGGMGRR